MYYMEPTLDGLGAAGSSKAKGDSPAVKEYWEKAKLFGGMALAEIEDAADGVFGKNVNQKWLDWSKAAKSKFEKALAGRDLATITKLQKEAGDAESELPTALAARIVNFVNLTAPKEVKEAFSAAKKRSSTPASGGGGGGAPPDMFMSTAGPSYQTYIGLALIAGAALLLLRRK